MKVDVDTFLRLAIPVLFTASPCWNDVLLSTDPNFTKQINNHNLVFTCVFFFVACSLAFLFWSKTRPDSYWAGRVQKHGSLLLCVCVLFCFLFQHNLFGNWYRSTAIVELFVFLRTKIKHLKLLHFCLLFCFFFSNTFVCFALFFFVYFVTNT